MAEDKDVESLCKKEEEIDYLSVKNLYYLIKTANAQGGRFCFILGSGTSVGSGIPEGRELEMRWMNCLMGKEDDGTTKKYDPDEVKEWAKALQLKHCFKALQEAWQQVINSKEKKIPSKYYFDIYHLRFFPNMSDGYLYMKQLMENATPSIGHHALAQLITTKSAANGESEKHLLNNLIESEKHLLNNLIESEKHLLNNLIITTNFDSLIEDSISLFTEEHPLVFEHESLADYIPLDADHPIVVKVHRGLWFDPLNSSKETTGLKSGWREALRGIFKYYTPIVIGYGGGDQSLMPFLGEEGTQLNGLFWCIREKSSPSPEVRKLVKEKGGCFVRIKSFNSFMLDLVLRLYGDAMTPTQVNKHLTDRFNAQISNYSQQFAELLKELADNPKLAVLEAQEKDEVASREEEGTITAWDYYYRAKSYENAGKYNEAIEDYSRAIEKNDKYVFAYHSRGYCNFELGRSAHKIKKGDGEPYFRKARDDFNKEIELSPNGQAYNDCGRCYSKLGQDDEAIKQFNKALELNPGDSFAYHQRGHSYFKMEKYAEAIDDFSKEIKLNPNPQAYNDRGQCYTALGQFDKAIADHTTAISLNPKDDYAYEYRADAYDKAEKPDLAKADRLSVEELKKINK